MRDRLRSWTKLLAVQKQMVQLAEGRLAELLRRQRLLEDEQHALLQSFGSDERFVGLFIDLRARRFQALSKSLEQMRPAIAAAEASVLDQAKRSRGIELKVEAVTQEYRADADRHELSEIIETAMTRAPASLP